MRASEKDRAREGRPLRLAFCHRESGCVPGGGFCLRWAVAHFFPIDGHLEEPPLEEPPHVLRVSGSGRVAQLFASCRTRRACAHSLLERSSTFVVADLLAVIILFH